jgi:hypothetical protein
VEAIDPKVIKRRILATTPPTDILHRAMLINMALIPIYNHVMMALPVGKLYSDELQKEVLKFLWTCQHEGQSKQKRRLVAKNRLGAGLEMGGLGIQSTVPAKSLGRSYTNSMKRAINSVKNIFCWLICMYRGHKQYWYLFSPPS